MKGAESLIVDSCFLRIHVPRDDIEDIHARFDVFTESHAIF